MCIRNIKCNPIEFDVESEEANLSNLPITV